MQAFPAAQLQGTTLLLPVVSVGNVGQLTADLLISTCRLERTARLHDDCLLPAVGSKGYAHVEGLATAMELYQQPTGSSDRGGGGGGGGVAVVQQRAPAAPGTQEAFAMQLAAFLKQSGVKEVVVLGSIEATARRGAQLAGSQLRFWAPEDSSSSGGSTQLQQRCSGQGLLPLEPSFFEDRALEARLLPPWPLLRHLQQQGVPCAAILSFTTEGDNVGEAFVMAAAAAKAAGLPEAPHGGEAAATQQWVPPPSWQYVYGVRAAVY